MDNNEAKNQCEFMWRKREREREHCLPISNGLAHYIASFSGIGLMLPKKKGWHGPAFKVLCFKKAELGWNYITNHNSFEI